MKEMERTRFVAVHLVLVRVTALVLDRLMAIETCKNFERGYIRCVENHRGFRESR